MLTTADLFYGGIVPGVVAAVTLAVVWRVTGKAASAWRTALVVGYVAGHWALDAQGASFAAALTKSFRPAEAKDWLPLLALLAMAPDALACVGKFGPAIGWCLRAALCVFAPWRLLYGSVNLPIPLEGLDIDLGGWSTGEAAAWIGGIAAALLLAWSSMRGVDPQENPMSRLALAALVALGSAVTMAMSASLVYGQLFGVLTATLVGCGLAAALSKTGRGPDVTAGPIVVLFGCLLVMGHFYAELKLPHAALLLAAMTLATGWLPRLEKVLPSWRLAGRAVLCLATLGVVLLLAGREFAAAISSDAADPYQAYGAPAP